MDNGDKTISDKAVQKNSSMALQEEKAKTDNSGTDNGKTDISQTSDIGHNTASSESNADEAKENSNNNTENKNAGGSDNNNEEDSQNEIEIKSISITSKSFLELLPGKYGTLLAAFIANILTEGLTAQQENILGNFLSAVGSLISYKASRDELDESNDSGVQP